LATSIKIKGHQHFPNQTHTDPGINWDWSLYYNLINPCSSPTALVASNIATSSANLTWTAAAGAASYSVQYKTAAATTWTTATATTNSLAITGLSASTAYNWQVATNCTGNASTYIAGANFTTLAPPCNAPAALTVSNINTSTASLSFTGAAGANSYTLDYKTAAETTYTTVTQTATSLNLTGLAASTVYNWRVKTTCTSGVSAYTTGANFTTQATCYDVNEPNNSSSTATALANGVTKYGKLCSGDFDWYKVTTTSTQTISVTLSQLPVDYNLDLYVNGAWVAASANAGTTAETITRTAQPAGTYYFRVYPPTTGAVYSTTLDYKVVASISAAILNTANETDESTLNNTIASFKSLQVAPNPIENTLNIRYLSPEKGAHSLQVNDVFGRTLFLQNELGNNGEQTIEIDASTWIAGIYFVTLDANNERKTIKVLKK
jgi:hypothetical protein